VGYLIDPPEPVEGEYVAVFGQTDLADALAVEFLKDHGLHPIVMPQMGDLGAAIGGGIGGGGGGLYGGEALLCVPRSEAEQALDLLEFDSGLLEDVIEEGDAE
jgi:hypothetical protein